MKLDPQHLQASEVLPFVLLTPGTQKRVPRLSFESVLQEVTETASNWAETGKQDSSFVLLLAQPHWTRRPHCTNATNLGSAWLTDHVASCREIENFQNIISAHRYVNWHQYHIKVPHNSFLHLSDWSLSFRDFTDKLCGLPRCFGRQNSVADQFQVFELNVDGWFLRCKQTLFWCHTDKTPYAWPKVSIRLKKFAKKQQVRLVSVEAERPNHPSRRGGVSQPGGVASQGGGSSMTTMTTHTWLH